MKILMVKHLVIRLQTLLAARKYCIFNNILHFYSYYQPSINMLS